MASLSINHPRLRLYVVCLVIGLAITAGTTIASAGALRAPMPAVTLDSCSASLWAPRASFPITNMILMAVSGLGDDLYTFGGAAPMNPLTAAFHYHAGTDTWIAIAPLPAPRNAATAVSDGTYLYIFGGEAQSVGMPQSTLWRYDPVAGTYTQLASMPSPALLHAAAYVSGKIYSLSGCNTQPCTPIATVQVYDTATNTWSPAAPLPQGFINGMAASDGQYLYAGGGYDGTNKLDKTYRYDPATNTWDDDAVVDLPVGLDKAASGFLHGKWIIAGGRTQSASTDSVIAWDPPTNTWTALASLPEYSGARGASAGPAFYVVGGIETQATLRLNDHVCITYLPYAACNDGN